MFICVCVCVMLCSECTKSSALSRPCSIFKHILHTHLIKLQREKERERVKVLIRPQSQGSFSVCLGRLVVQECDVHVCVCVFYVFVCLYTSSPMLMFTVLLSSTWFETFLPLFCQQSWEPRSCHFAKHVLCNIPLLGSQTIFIMPERSNIIDSFSSFFLNL